MTSTARASRLSERRRLHKPGGIICLTETEEGPLKTSQPASQPTSASSPSARPPQAGRRRRAPDWNAAA
ncbi:hypothetical protein [Thermogemmatispora sp.]|uniref:hypothetical protein n=1 Tax=Thermogemmatispora sp. TaxID=1968838 RepID=UPI0035E41491